jgi:hypothetical protein
VRGSGPVVVMQSGRGDGAAVWRKVQGEVAAIGFVCSKSTPHGASRQRPPPAQGPALAIVEAIRRVTPSS